MTPPTSATAPAGPRPRVLVIAYACEPSRGSEPGAGWAVVQAVAQFADCTVLVGREHAAAIDRWERGSGGRGPHFVVVEERRWPGAGHGGRVMRFLRYLGWLRHAERTARRLHAEQPFDVVHHLTYSTYWLPTPAARLGVPSVWGPVGGAVTTPLSLWPALGAGGIASEVLDLVAVRLLAGLPATRRVWRAASIRIVQNEATRRRLPAPLRADTVVLNHALFTEAPHSEPRPRGRHVLLVGVIETRKGPRLAITALAHAPDDVHLVVVGDGPERASMERLAERLGVAHRVEFKGRVPHAEVLPMITDAAAVLFTGMREEGGIALAESMLCGTPVIVLSNGGARTVAEAGTDAAYVALVEPGRVTVTSRKLADAMTHFSRHPRPSAEPLLDSEAARRALRAAFDAAIAISGN